ncbi:MAG: hypothetical protein M3H12_03200, partial [Chromatiales bacterium]
MAATGRRQAHCDVSISGDVMKKDGDFVDLYEQSEMLSAFFFFFPEKGFALSRVFSPTVYIHLYCCTAELCAILLLFLFHIPLCMMHITAQPALLFKKVPHMPIENILEYRVFFHWKPTFKQLPGHEFMSEMARYS